MAITGANMWPLLLDKDPGHSAAAGDLAVDVVYWKLKKAAAAAAAAFKVEDAPPARDATKSVNSGEKSKKMKKVATGCSKQASASAAIVHGGGKVMNINGASGDNKQAAAADGEDLTDMWISRYLCHEETSKKEEGKFAVVGGGRRRTVAPRTCNAAIAEGVTVPAGANMWDLLLDKDPGHSAAACDLAVDVVDRKRKVEETPPARNIAKTTKRGEKSKKNKEGAAGCSKNSAASAAIVRDGEEPMSADVGDNNQTAATDDEELTNILIRRYLSQEETSKKGENEAMFTVVAGGRRRKLIHKHLANSDPSKVAEAQQHYDLALCIANTASAYAQWGEVKNLVKGVGGTDLINRVLAVCWKNRKRMHGSVTDMEYYLLREKLCGDTFGG
ncbi:hypothetical protein ACQ4PT_057962 [Festuca glaucescens]